MNFRITKKLRRSMSRILKSLTPYRSRGRRAWPEMPALSASTTAEIIGCCLIGVGLALIYEPLGWIWGGMAMFAVSYTVERRSRTNELSGHGHGQPAGTPVREPPG